MPKIDFKRTGEIPSPKVKIGFQGELKGEKLMSYVVSQERKTWQWYCHMKGYPHIPCFGSFCEKKSEAMEYAKMYNGFPHKVVEIAAKRLSNT